jgi:hypothetical protein
MHRDRRTVGAGREPTGTHVRRAQHLSTPCEGLPGTRQSLAGATYDTRVPLRNEFGPLAAPTTIAPGKTAKVPWIGKYLFVRWRGPLQVTPGCGQKALPAQRVGVTAPGPPPDERTAVADAVSASNHLLDHCRPERARIPVQGLIYPPGRDAPPMPATCSVSSRKKEISSWHRYSSRPRPAWMSTPPAV